MLFLAYAVSSFLGAFRGTFHWNSMHEPKPLRRCAVLLVASESISFACGLVHDRQRRASAEDPVIESRDYKVYKPEDSKSFAMYST